MAITINGMPKTGIIGPFASIRPAQTRQEQPPSLKKVFIVFSLVKWV